MKKQLLRDRRLLAGTIITVLLILTAITGPYLVPYDPITDISSPLQAPNLNHPFGTDQYGRDLFSRIIWGTRLALLIGVGSQLANTLVGIVLGVLAGYFGSLIDGLIMGVTNIVLSIPVLVFALMLMAFLGPGLISLLIALAIVNWTYSCRTIRGSVLSVKEKDYVEAAEGLGASKFRIIVYHLIPNILSPILVIATLGIGSAIILASSLSFIGVGVQPPNPGWGAILSQGRTYLLSAPWMVAFPGLMIFFAVLGFNLLGDGLRDYLDPQLGNEMG
ncbi:ABC transporter permease [Candidatus Bipolaricaulota bacterium]|nr:ABC transporter permease [Candidatus Bipolaricaulota bacterium]MBS3792114.1 ABC transporter permease [Candidatus Bipolaricaulota bacterium]